ncbi:MAG: YncE family protein [Thermomicrobiales bacterium]
MTQRTIPLTQPTPTHRSGRRISVLEAITAVAMVAALLAVGARATGRLPDERTAAIPDQPTRLLQMDRTWDGTQMRWQGFLRTLDPATGAETGEPLPLRLPGDGSIRPVFSADGRTVAYTDTQPPLTPPGVKQPASIVTVADSVTGAIRWTLPFDLSTFVMRLNSDGSRLMLYRLSTGQHSPFTLLTVDVASGATLSTIMLPFGSDAWPTIAPDLRTAYVLDTHNTGTWPNVTSGDVTLYLIDTTTGAQRTVPLPMVHAGVFPTDRTVHGQPVIRSFSPGIVASPDSKWLYIVHPGANAITVINLKEGRVERTESIHPTLSAARQLFGWLMPQRVAAKEAPESTDTQATVSPDGRTLAITGTMVHPQDDGSYDVTDEGIQFVDLRTFTETAHLLQRQYQGYARSLNVQWSADGRLLYIGNVISSTTPDDSTDAYQLRIMDVRSHAITATQTYVAEIPTTVYLLATWFALPQ